MLDVKQRIVIVTDCFDVAANELRATLIANLEKIEGGDKVEVEPVVVAECFSVINGAFLVRLMAEIYSPTVTTFLVVLNPLRTDRKDRARIIGRTKNGFRFIGENTGTLGWLIKDFGIQEIYESSRLGIDGKEFISFGGKYIHAPIAAKAAVGIPLKQLGTFFDPERITMLDIKEGTIVHIDNFGVAKVFMSPPALVDGSKVKILVNGVETVEAIFTNSMKNLPDQTWAVYPGSSLNHLLEFGLVRDYGAKKLGLKGGDIIQVKH